MPKQGVNISETSNLASAEFLPDQPTLTAVLSGCISQAVKGISASDKSNLRTEIQTLQTNLAKAIDLVKKRRSKLAEQKNILAKERDTIGEGDSNFARFHSLAKTAIQNCADVTAAAQNAKAGISLVFTKANELAYRISLLDPLDADLSSLQNSFQDAMSKLDEININLSG